MNTINNIIIKQDVCVWGTNAPDNGQFQGHKDKYLWYQYKDLVIRNAHVQCEISSFHYFVMKNVYFFLKMSQISRSKGLVTKGSYPNLYSCEVWKLWHTLEKILTRLKFSEQKVKYQDQCHLVKNIGILRKVLSQRRLMLNIKALAPIVRQLLARLFFFFKK